MVFVERSWLSPSLIIRPSLKGGLCKSAGQKKRDVVVINQSLRLGLSGSSSLALGMGNQSNDG